MNAVLDIQIGILVRQRLDSEPFRPTITWTESRHYQTDLRSYQSVVSTAATDAITYITNQPTGSYSEVHVAIRLGNPTHPTPAAGVVPLAKGHQDIAFTQDEVPTAVALQTAINAAIVNMQATAQY